MDLQLFARVLWRFRFLVVLGLGLAITSALLAFVRVELDGTTGKPVLSYRGDETWAVTNTLLVTQRGFPWGRSVLPTPEEELVDPATEPEPSKPELQFGDSTRFSTLALLYTQLATSGAVRDRLSLDESDEGEIEAAPVMLADSTSLTLPLIKLTATADSPGLALDLVRRATHAFNAFLFEKQSASAIPPAERVVVTVVDAPTEATLAESRPLTIPLICFLGVTFATLALVFALENLWPGKHRSALTVPSHRTAG